MRLAFVVVGLVIGHSALANPSYIKKEYVDRYKGVAIQQMIQFKIPASITLAQGLLESGVGRSPLATKGNNHFGIKCSNWTGQTMYHDDDKKGECFRVYASADESYMDHSEFLTSKDRYAALFELDIKDYKGWAKGLRKAGYATDLNYPNRIISLIEELNLYEQDIFFAAPDMGLLKPKENNQTNSISIDGADGEKEKNNKSNTKRKHTSIFSEAKPAIALKHKIYIQDKRTKYIIAEKGDTYFRLSLEFNIPMWELRKYNGFDKRKDVLEPGDVVYIKPNRKNAKKNIEMTSTLYSK